MRSALPIALTWPLAGVMVALLVRRGGRVAFPAAGGATYLGGSAGGFLGGGLFVTLSNLGGLGGIALSIAAAVVGSAAVVAAVGWAGEGV